jgi:GTPase SAR1 family protein
MNQYISSNFREEYEETIGVEFESKVLELDDDVKIQIQAWDTVRLFSDMKAGDK